MLNETQTLLRRSRESAGQIARHTGLDRQWVRLIKRGDIENPGVVYIERLRDYLRSAEADRKGEGA